MFDPLSREYRSDQPLGDRVDYHFRSVSLPLQDVQGMMRHVLDCLGALRFRLNEPETVVAPHVVRIFADSVRMLMDDIAGFEPVDNESAVKYLLESFPDENKRGDGRQWLPLHWAAAVHSTEAEHMEAIISERPVHLIKGHLKYEESESTHPPREAVNDREEVVPHSYKGLLPLHLICSLRHPRVDNVRQLITRSPVTLQCADHRGWLALHWCAFNNRHVDVLQMLIRGYPDACFETTKRGKLPFQVAAYNRYTFMLDILLQENPDAIHGMDYNGNTALHDAAKSLNHEGVKKLLSYKPELNRTRNFKEELPIHKVFSFLPSADSVQDNGGETVNNDGSQYKNLKAPRRLFHRQLETVKALLAVNPEIAALPDRNDSLPLHLAVFHHAPYEVVEYIYNVYPSAALRKDNEGKLPIHYVTNSAVKKLLMKSSPPLVKAGLTDTFSRFIM